MPRNQRKRWHLRKISVEFAGTGRSAARSADPDGLVVLDQQPGRALIVGDPALPGVGVGGDRREVPADRAAVGAGAVLAQAVAVRGGDEVAVFTDSCLLYTSPSPRDGL